MTSLCCGAEFDIEALQLWAPRSPRDQEVAIFEEFSLAQSRNEFAQSVLRATFVALTAGLFVVWLASAS
jgi:hypothetical protein